MDVLSAAEDILGELGGHVEASANEAAAAAMAADGDLPPDWVEKTSQQYAGRKYYFNTKTNETTWERPKEDPGAGLLTGMTHEVDPAALYGDPALYKNPANYGQFVGDMLACGLAELRPGLLGALPGLPGALRRLPRPPIKKG